MLWMGVDAPVPENRRLWIDTRREILRPTAVLRTAIERISCLCRESNPGTRKRIIAVHERTNQYSRAIFVIHINKTVYFSQTTNPAALHTWVMNESHTCIH
jgi:hypothetical protein